MRAEKISPSTKTSGGDSAGEVRERDAEAAIFVLMDHGDVVLAHDGLGFGALSIVQAAAVALAGAASAAVVAVWVCCSLQGFLRSRFGGGVARPSVGPPTTLAAGYASFRPSVFTAFHSHAPPGLRAGATRARPRGALFWGCFLPKSERFESSDYVSRKGVLGRLVEPVLFA
jgi:hypothetical protein